MRLFQNFPYCITRARGRGWGNRKIATSDNVIYFREKSTECTTIESAISSDWIMHDIGY